MNPQVTPHITIIGGGITGLAAAWELHSRGHTAYTIIEVEPGWGGKVVTRRVSLPDGEAIIEGGPESFVTRKPQAWELAHELGLGEQVRTPTSQTSGMYVLHDGQLLPAPTSPQGFLTTRLLTPGAKARMLSEPFVRPRLDLDDESIADFVDRRLGRQARERFLGPVLGGIYNCDAERQSVLVAAPVMREMERESGSLVAGAVRRAKAARAARRQEPGDTRPRFFTMAGGTAALVDTLVARLTGELRTGVAVTRITRITRDGRGRWSVGLADGSTFDTDAVLLTVVPRAAAGLLSEVAPAAAVGLDRMPATSIGTATLVYAAPAPSLPLPVHGLMIPRSAGRRIDAVSVSSATAPHRFPPGALAVRVFFGGADPDLVTRSDDDLAVVLRAELTDLIGLDALPTATTVFRWPGGFPLADVGHLDRLAAVEAALPEGLALAGSGYRGLGVPDCIRQGRERVGHLLSTTTPPATDPRTDR